MSAVVADNPELLKTLLEDSEIASPLWQPTAYWRNYTGRITREIERVGLSEFRSNHTICKGYALGGVPEPIPPVTPWKRNVWNSILRAPVFNRVIDVFRHQISVSHHRLRRAETRYAHLVLDMLADQLPDMKFPDGIGNGQPDDVFEWRGHTVTASWIEQLCRVADFYASVPADKVEAIIEIGPGIGQSTLAHLALNTNLKTVVNVDIVPILYVSTQFLKSSGEFEVVDYLDTRDEKSVAVKLGNEKPRLYQLPPWQLPRVTGKFDFFFNAFSFQEMERDVCRNYAQCVLPMLKGGAFLHSAVAGHLPGAGSQLQPVAMDFLIDLFASRFPNRGSASSFSSRFYGYDPAGVALLE